VLHLENRLSLRIPAFLRTLLGKRHVLHLIFLRLTGALEVYGVDLALLSLRKLLWRIVRCDLVDRRLSTRSFV